MKRIPRFHQRSETSLPHEHTEHDLSKQRPCARRPDQLRHHALRQPTVLLIQILDPRRQDPTGRHIRLGKFLLQQIAQSGKAGPRPLF